MPLMIKPYYIPYIVYFNDINIIKGQDTDFIISEYEREKKYVKNIYIYIYI